jgi:gliding motility-associated-like protein
MRVRCAFATAGTNITPCGTFGFGETEDYTIYVGAVPPSAGVVTATASLAQPTICVGQSLSFNIATANPTALTYTWTGPGSYSSTAQNPIISSAQATASGVYTAIISNGTCPTSRTVSALVVPFPTLSIVPSAVTICQGGSFTASVTVVGNPSSFSYSWTTAAPGLLFNPQQQSTLITPALVPVSQSVAVYNYSVTVSPLAYACPNNTFMTLTINNPFTPSLSLVSPLCDVSTPVQLVGTPGGGVWGGSPAVSTGGFFNPALANNSLVTVSYSVAAGNCMVSNSGTIEVSKFHTAALTSSVSLRCVQDPLFYLKNIVQDTATGSWSGTNVTNNFFNPAGLATGNYILTYNSPSYPNPTVCPSSTTLVMPVFNPPVPQITAIVPRCNTSGPVQLSASPSGGVWSGNPGVSPVGVQTPSLNSNGVNSVTYTAGQGTCVAASSRTFSVSRFNTAALTGTIPQLCVNNAGFNLMSIVQNTTGAWSGISVSNGAFLPAGLPTGIYTLQYNTSSFPDATLCPDSRSINVSVLNPPTPSIQAAGPFCSRDATVQMNVIPAVGQWLSSSYLSSTGVLTPSLAPIGNNMISYVIGTNTCNTQQTIFVDVEAFVPATVIQQLRDVCVTTPVINLAPFTANSTGNWVGQGITGNNFSPAMAGAGQFDLIYKTASQPSNLCPDADTLSVRVFSLAAPLVNAAGPFCNNALPVKLKVSPLGGVFAGANTGALSTDGLFNPALGVIGKNLISYSISSGPCIAYTQATVEVEAFVSAAIIRSPDLAYCVNQEPFNLNGFVQNPGGTWTGPGLVGANMFNPALANVGGKNILTYHTQSKNNALLCPDVSTLILTVKDLPKASIQTSSLSGCAPLKVTFSSPENTMGKGLWSLDDGSKTEGFSMAHTFTRSGTYDVIYNYEDTEAPGCSLQVKLSNPVIVYPQPVAGFEVPEEITMNDPKVKFQNTSTPLMDNQYLWTVQGLEQYFDVHPVIEFPERGTYRINLQATDVRGCKAEVTRFVEVKNDFGFFIPNSFTPNFDGLNDFFMPVFSPYGIDTEGYSLQVFDRWGREVFTTHNTATAWDGTYLNKGGNLLKEDTYTYQVQVRDLDGRVYKKQGTVSLLR